MSNTIAHLMVANRILKELPTLVKNIDAFYLGNIAPDTIESKYNCSRNDKKRVHLREEIRDSEWLDNKKMSQFKNRIKHFIDEYILSSSGDQHDFNIGYLVHLLTDEWNHRTIRQRMLRKANEVNVLESDKEFFYMMTNDLEALDNYLLNNNEEIQKVLDKILKVEPKYSLTGFIEKEYIEKSIDWWINVYLINIKRKELQYLSINDINEFINIATKEIIIEIQKIL